MTWQPLSRRTSGAKPDGPYEGVPAHMRASVLQWVLDTTAVNGSVDAPAIREAASQLRVTLTKANHVDQRTELIEWAGSSPAHFLDLMDVLLNHRVGQSKAHGQVYGGLLRKILSNAGSAWTVAEDNDGLVRVVNEQTQATFDASTSVSDTVSDELREAWANAFGINGNASDAWDHAIKAVEDVLVPAVCPNKAKANLGGVIGDLDKQGHLWKLCLPGHDSASSVAPLVGMLRLIWPNPDRHGGAERRPPTAQESRAVVPLAATIVQWHREGGVVHRR